MEEPRKLSLKRVEISLTKFNDVAIPHHLDLLRQHKTNIIKFQEAGELNRVKNEQINARRLVSQLKNLLAEMDVLRQQVADGDLEKFDRMTQLSRRKTLKAIMEYLDNPPVQDIPMQRLEIKMPSPSLQSTTSTESIGNVLAPRIQLVVDETQLEMERLNQQEECLKGWEELHSEMQDLYDIFVKFQSVIDEQKTHVNLVEGNVENAAVNIDDGRRTLAKAERYKLTLYPLAGALLGGCIAGPIGLIAGLKVAGAALIGGGILGFTGGSLIKNKKDTELKENAVPEMTALDESEKDK